MVLHDLQVLSNETSCDRGTGILFFKMKYPVLFDALYSVFGLLPSNSRLCEQVHGMLRQSLSSGIGMDQSDAQFSYKVNTEYQFRQERRELVNTSNDEEVDDEKRKTKVSKHDKTKEQTEMIGQQMCDFIATYDNADLSTVTSVRKITKIGRRTQDKNIAGAKEALEKEKQARMTREVLTIDEVRNDASSLIPDFELNNRLDHDLLRRKITQQLCIIENWTKQGLDVGTLKSSLENTFRYIKYINNKNNESRIQWDNIKSKESLKKNYISPYMKSIKKVVQLWLDFMYGKKVNGARDHNPIRDGSWDAIDLMSYFFVNFNTAVTKVDTSRKKKKWKKSKLSIL